MKKEILPILVIASMFILAISFYSAPCLPDQLPTHWNSMGEVDGYGSKMFVLWFFPLLTLGIYLLMMLLPKIDPLRKNYEKFKTPYFVIRTTLVVFFGFLYFYTIIASLGYAPNINYFIIPFVSLMLVVFGIVMPKIKKNYFVGIRTPWTLQSDKVWEETHKVGGISLIVTGILTLFTLGLGKYMITFYVVLIVAGSLVPVVYSYFLYRKLKLFKKK